MSPDVLRKLRKWLTLEDTASELSTALSEDVDASDVLRLVLDGQLKLSIYLPAKTTALCRPPNGAWRPCSRINRRTRSCEVRILSTRSFAHAFRYPSP